MTRYLEERDDYRATDGKSRIWKGANVAHSYRMMGNRRGLADRAAVQRAALDKRWRWHWAREDKMCSACGDLSVGIKHPLRYCKNEAVIDERAKWRARDEACLKKAPLKQRASLEDLWSCMERRSTVSMRVAGSFWRDSSAS